ncbi:MAG: nucleotidyl transferase AbiEii/AbiGii toxin family protein [Patescibacteria group bacterium]
MTPDISLHRTILFQVLKDIYSDTTIAPLLGFKGGTAAVMFHNLDRFSVDLDFDLLDEGNEDHVFERITKIIKKYGAVKDSYKKRNNLFWLLSYEDKARNIKVEVNRRHFGSSYEIRSYLGVSMLVMIKEDMFAHKLMAMFERIGKTSRDIYDVWFFLEKHFPINKTIVEQRAKMPFEQLVKKCVEKLEKMNNRNILMGLGELLTDGQKDWARAKLKQETIALLMLKISDDLNKFPVK